MNYIELLNQFWQTRRKVRLSSNEADLYYFLLNESNSRMWENPFECSNGLICVTIGMSEKTLIDVRNRLQQKGLIYFESGERKKKSPVYTLLYCKKESINVSIEGSITNSINVSKTPNLLYKLNKEENKEEKVIEKNKRFSPPSLNDVIDFYIDPSGMNLTPVDSEYWANRFVDFYTSKGWKVGNQSMKDWKAAARRCVREWDDKRQKTQQNADVKLTSSVDYGDKLRKQMLEDSKRKKDIEDRQRAQKSLIDPQSIEKHISLSDLENIKERLRDL